MSFPSTDVCEWKACSRQATRTARSRRSLIVRSLSSQKTRHIRLSSSSSNFATKGIDCSDVYITEELALLVGPVQSLIPRSPIQGFPPAHCEYPPLLDPVLRSHHIRSRAVFHDATALGTEFETPKEGSDGIITPIILPSRLERA